MWPVIIPAHSSFMGIKGSMGWIGECLCHRGQLGFGGQGAMVFGFGGLILLSVTGIGAFSGYLGLPGASSQTQGVFRVVQLAGPDRGYLTAYVQEYHDHGTLIYSGPSPT